MAGQRGILVIACLCLNLDIWQGVTCTGMVNMSMSSQPMHEAIKVSDHGALNRGVP